MDGAGEVGLTDFTSLVGGGAAVTVCLSSAQWFCELLRADPPPDRLARAVGRLVEAYASAAATAGEYAPQLLPVRELLTLVAGAAAVEPAGLSTGLAGLAAAVERTPTAAFVRLREGRDGHRLRAFEVALDREYRLCRTLPAGDGLTPPRPDDRVYVPHMSCAKLDDTPAGTPEASAVVVRHLVTGRCWAFAAYQEAEPSGEPPDPRDREAGMLRRFFRFAGDHPNAVWLHWNMNEPRFGFAALAQRHRALTGADPPDIPPRQQFDLAEYLKREFGPHYAIHPRLHRMIDLNRLGGGRYLDLEAADRSWSEGRYAALVDGAAARASAIGEMYRLLWDGRLRIEGGRLVGIGRGRVNEPGPGPAAPPPPDAPGGEPCRPAPPTDGRFDGLRSAAEKLRLKGNEAAIVERLCRGIGRVPLADLATACEWTEPCDGTWNAARVRLNGKLKKHGWRLCTHDRCAVAEPLPAGARK